MNTSLFNRASTLQMQEATFALVTILSTEGSASRNQGIMLVETSKAITSTVGGGALEAFAIEQALQTIKSNIQGRIVHFTIDQEGKKAAGQVSLFIQVIRPTTEIGLFAAASKWEQTFQSFVYGFSLTENPSNFLLSNDGTCYGEVSQQLLSEAKKTLALGENRQVACAESEYFFSLPLSPYNLLLVGGGHVNQAIARLAHMLGYGVQVVETREEYASFQLFPHAQTIICEARVEDGLKLARINQFTSTIIASHSFNQEAASFLLTTEAPYIGVLGSHYKAKALFQRIQVPSDEKKRIFCPIGLDIGTETPAEIAVSVLSEVMKVQTKRTGRSLRLGDKHLIIVRGGGDLATGVIIRLVHAGYPVLVLEIDKPTVIRTTVSLAQAMFDQKITVEDVTAVRCETIEDAYTCMEQGIVPILCDPEGNSIKTLEPLCVIDAILAKKNLGTTMEDAPLVLALGPGFTAGKDCHYVIETMRGHSLARIISEGEAIPNTGTPGLIGGFGKERVMHSPHPGVFHSHHHIGDLVELGDIIAHVDEHPVYATLTGKLRGLLNNGLVVTKGFKIIDIDPRGEKADHTTVSEKAKAIGGGVLEALDSFVSKL
ncbi:MAG: selenium-dependent molybdenum cofactor biosynthesis protein YqeB [Sphaerochaeta sp.]